MDTIFFSFDAETDGLYGDVFAIGAVVMRPTGDIVDSFGGVSNAQAVLSEWVRENSLPHLSDLIEYDSREALLEAFWSFYHKWRAHAVIVADVPYPVEANLLRRCVEKDLDGRMPEAPFPLIDVASILFAKGFDPLLDRMAFSGKNGRRHHPVDDAAASCLCLLKVLNLSK